MRVRKPTSKRTSTRMREGIKKKAAAQKRKDVKKARKSPQWKSRKPKELGIPSSFPYKDDIINEVENKRREVAEQKLLAKQKRLEERAATKDEDAMDEDEDVEEAEEGEGGLAALVESAQKAAKEYDGEATDEMVDDGEPEDLEFVDIEVASEEEDEYQKNDNESETSMKAFSKFFKAVMNASDVILYVLDARDPEGTRSKSLEESILNAKDKKLILLLNKVDLVPNDVMKQWLNYYKGRFPIIPVKGNSSSALAVGNNFNKNLSQSVTAGDLITSLKSYANKSNLKRSIVVGVCGFPNVGKSSIINALTSKHGGNSKVCPVGNQPGITTSLREIKVDNKLKIIDSPGIVFPPQVTGIKTKKLKLQQDAKLILLNAIPTRKIKDATLAIQLLIKRLQKNPESWESFTKHYEIPEAPNNDLEEFSKLVLINVARKRGRLGKGGVPNLHSAALCILNDWKDGRFVGWTVAPETPLEAKLSENTIKVSGKVEQTTIVQEWSKEFDLDGLFASTGINEE